MTTPRKNSIGQGKERVTFDDDQIIVEQIDAIAVSEGLSRSDICRRALRFLLSNSSTSRTIPLIESVEITSPFENLPDIRTGKPITAK